MAPVDKNNNTEQLFVIESGQSPKLIASRLQQAHLIRSSFGFEVYTTLHGLRGHLQAGTYSFKPSTELRVIARDIAAGKVSTNQFQVPEGLTVAKISKLATAQHISGFDEAVVAAHANAFLDKVPQGAGLEGYLFPDTYQITPNTSGAQLVQTMLDNFGKRVGADRVAGLAAKGLTLHQGITLASIVEREVAKPSDRAIVAAIFLKRLELGMRLQSDVTVDYGATLLGKAFSTAVDSPYNTYQVAGLPLGPICNPGLGAIDAVINAGATDYLFFLADAKGNTHYAKTQAEHEANVAQYLR